MFQTPLHMAAEHDAKDCVRLLLQNAADPTKVDARGRVPVFLAASDACRDVFRVVRSELGEDAWDWSLAKVGPPITEEEMAQKQRQQAEKRRKKRLKQKERKAASKAEEAEAEARRVAAEEKQKAEEEAKRVRDGLGLKKQGSCDFCQTVCKGRKRAQMFHRLGYSYCSSQCVERHKRELMAAAAAARFANAS